VPQLSAYPRSRYPRGNARLRYLPGDYGWPVIGHTLALINDPYRATKRMYDRYGPVFRSSGFLQKAIIMVGPEPAREILQDPEGKLSARMGWHPVLGDMFEGGLLVRDFEDHQRHRKSLQFAFTPAAMRRYFAILDAFLACEIARLFSTEGEQTVTMFPVIKRLALEAAVRCFLDCDDPDRLERLQKSVLQMVAATITLLRADLPGTVFRRGMRARAVTWTIINELMDEKALRHDGDFLSELTRRADSDDDDLTRQDVLLHTSFMLMASHDTTASALTSMLYFLAGHPDWQRRLREELLGIEPNDFHYDRLAELEICDVVFKETVRLHTPAPITPRRTVRDCTIAGIDIPANTNVTFNAAFTHRMAVWWADPDEFAPDRFLEPRSEQKQHPMLWVPFGAGVHRCMGLHFALTEIKAFLYRFVRAFEFCLIDGESERFTMLPMPRPVRGLPLVLRPLRSA
jgi:cytochrome P450